MGAQMRPKGVRKGAPGRLEMSLRDTQGPQEGTKGIQEGAWRAPRDPKELQGSPKECQWSSKEATKETFGDQHMF